MNRKLQPVGQKILVLPLQEKNYITETNIEIIQIELAKCKVLEVSKEYSDIYNVGDTLIYSKGAGISQPYNGENCLWISAKGYPEGDVWAIETQD